MTSLLVYRHLWDLHSDKRILVNDKSYVILVFVLILENIIRQNLLVWFQVTHRVLQFKVGLITYKMKKNMTDQNVLQ